VRLRPVAVAGFRELVHGERESFSARTFGRRLTGAPIDDWDDLDRLPIDGHVELEVHRLHPIPVHPRLRSVVRWSCRGHCAGGAVALEALCSRQRHCIFS
jgi:hypothetical protein